MRGEEGLYRGRGKGGGIRSIHNTALGGGGKSLLPIEQIGVNKSGMGPKGERGVPSKRKKKKVGSVLHPFADDKRKAPPVGGGGTMNFFRSAQEKREK